MDEFNIWGEPKKQKRRPIDKNVRNTVWQIYNQNSLSGNCYVCKTPITYQHFHVGHNKAVAKKGNDDISNLRPICSSCNNGMGTMSIEKYKNKYFKSLHPEEVNTQNLKEDKQVGSEIKKETIKKKRKKKDLFWFPKVRI